MRRLGRLLLLSGAVLVTACTARQTAAGSDAQPLRRLDRSQLPLTRAERTRFAETSRHADVVAFLDSLSALDAPILVGSIGRSVEGREIPYVIASRPLARTPAEAHALARPIVYLQGNIHGGEVEGKEALQQLLRDLVFEQRVNVLDSIVLIAVPAYNVDGNEALGPQERHRPEQNGPALVGRRANGAGLDLNRDYMKAEAPETRASLAMLNAWKPDVFVDLHTTNGSFHGYALTYSPPLNPAAQMEDFTRGLLRAARARMSERHGIETFEYGNFGTDATPWQERAVYTPAVHAWTTFDSRPRFSTNYYGLRGGIAVLVEAYSHDPFEKRTGSTLLFVRELLSLTAERSDAMGWWRAVAEGVTVTRNSLGMIPIRARLTEQPETGSVLVELVERSGDTSRVEAGLAPGLRRTGRFTAVEMPLYTRFDASQFAYGQWGYVVPARLHAVLSVLRAHGIRMEPVGTRTMSDPIGFEVDSVRHAVRAFEGRREARVFGSWRGVAQPVSPTDYVVSLRQPLGRLAAYLLEPESDDGLAAWGFLEGELAPGAPYPVSISQGSSP